MNRDGPTDSIRNDIANIADLADRIDAALPQTQCTRCGYPDCRGYAEAIAAGLAPINQCPPGGAEGIERLAALTGRPPLPLSPRHGVEGPRRLALIDERWCIGCTLCIKACPVDAIVGAGKRMHTVISAHCTGCELCLPPCPVDCIAMVEVTPQRAGWDAWSPQQAEAARERYARRRARLQREAQEHEAKSAAKREAKLAEFAPGSSDPDAERKRAVIAAAIERARRQREQS